jgi:hypothetical protein
MKPESAVTFLRCGFAPNKILGNIFLKLIPSVFAGGGT